VISRPRRRLWIAVDGALGLTLAIVFSIGAVSGLVLAAPSATPASVARAVPAAHGYNVALDTSEAALGFGLAGTAPRIPASGSTAPSTDEFSALRAVLVAANGAGDALNGVRLGQQLARESADSVFTSSGRLSSGAIADSKEIISGSRLGNKDLISRLTSDGSDIADWGKYTTRTHQSPSGDFQVHFYMNRSTGAIDYGYDYKVIFNGAR
jgi:hypothetical protein